MELETSFANLTISKRAEEEKKRIEECPVCTDEVKIFVSCPSCQYQTCVVCLKTYLTTSTSIYPKCMNCAKDWDYEFIATNVKDDKWYTTVYLPYRVELIWERERSLLPTTQDDAIEYRIAEEKRERTRSYQKKIVFYRREQKLNCQKLSRFYIKCPTCKKTWTGSYSENSVCKTICNRKDTTNTEIAMMKLDSDYLNIINDHTTLTHKIEDLQHKLSAEPVKKEKNIIKKAEYSFPCPYDECRGFVSHGKCGICGKNICKKCHCPNEDEHKCNEDDIKSVLSIRKESKPCPSCKIPIHKISGCDQMWCPHCHCAFSWTKGTIETGMIHNPHYYQWMRENGSVPRQNGDVRCGGDPHFNDITRKIKIITSNGHCVASLFIQLSVDEIRKVCSKINTNSVVVTDYIFDRLYHILDSLRLSKRGESYKKYAVILNKLINITHRRQQIRNLCIEILSDYDHEYGREIHEIEEFVYNTFVQTSETRVKDYYVENILFVRGFIVYSGGKLVRKEEKETTNQEEKDVIVTPAMNKAIQYVMTGAWKMENFSFVMSFDGIPLWIYSANNLLIHLRHHLELYRPTNFTEGRREYRIKYILGYIESARWKSLLKAQEKRAEKERCVYNIMEMFTNTFSDLQSNLLEVQTAENVENIYKQIVHLCKYVDSCFTKLRIRYNNIIPSIKIISEDEWLFIDTYGGRQRKNRF